MMRPTEQEMVAIEKAACFLQFPRRGSQPCCSGHMGSTQVGQRHGEQGGNLDKVFTVVSVGRKDEAEQAGLGWLIWIIAADFGG